MKDLPDRVTAFQYLLQRALASIPDAYQGNILLDSGEQFAFATTAAEIALAAPPPDVSPSFEAPIVVNGLTAGVLCITCASGSVITAAMHDTAQLVAEQIGMVLERATLAGELAQTVQQGRFLNDVLDAVADAASIAEMVQTISSGIHHVLPRHHWPAVQLALCDADGKHAHTYELQGHHVHPYWRNVQAGVRTAGRDFAVKVEFIAATADGPHSQAVALANAIRTGVDGIALAPIDATALEPLIQQARQAGIPLVTFDSPPLEGSQSLLYIGIDNAAAGALAASVMQQLTTSAGPVALSTESLQVENARQRVAGFAAALVGSALGPLSPFDDRHDALNGHPLAQQTFQAHPNLVGIFAGSGCSAANWAPPLTAAGRAGHVKLVCFDISADTIALLKAGTAQAVIAQREYAMGYCCVQQLQQFIAEGIEPTLARAPVNRHIDTGADVVTLLRTPWSISLADYLATLRELDHPTFVPPRSTRATPPKITVIGMAEQVTSAFTAQQVAITPASLLGRVLQTAQPLVLESGTMSATDGQADGGDIGTHTHDRHTVIGMPLRARHGVLGMLRLNSAYAEECSPRDLALIRQIASAIAAVVENAQLVGQLAARQRDLEAATVRQQVLLDTLLELASPVVPIMLGILVLPLVGALDTMRMTQVNTAVLAALTNHRATVVIVDITGAHGVDTYVAQHLLHMSHAARLLGAEVMLVGVSPAIAETLVTLGVNLAALTPCADLAHGLATALARRGARIVYAPRK